MKSEIVAEGRAGPRMRVSAQTSIYPLRQNRLSPAISAVQTAMVECGLEPEIGRMSTLVSGEPDVVSAALRDAFARAGAHGQLVMVITVSNSFPE